MGDPNGGCLRAVNAVTTQLSDVDMPSGSQIQRLRSEHIHIFKLPDRLDDSRERSGFWCLPVAVSRTKYGKSK